MRIILYTICALLMSINLIFSNSFGYLTQVEASFCMDDCSHYMLQGENGDFITYLANTNNFDLSYFMNRYVEIEDGGEYQCIECSAMIIDGISISNSCDYPISCFADPCEVAEECQLNTPVDCVSNFCGGCYADFYDMNENLVDCYDNLDCTDLANINFGMCDMYLGVGYVSGQCNYLSGCGWVVDGVDYSDAFFDSIEACESECINGSNMTCTDIENEYEDIHSGEYDNCVEDSDCISIWGDCSVGLGGCHYSVNNESFNYEYSNELVDMWVDGDCMEWVCDCMDLPNSICNNGECELTYCDGPNPAGCFSTGCQDGYDCVDFGNQVYEGFCVPSSCFCEDSSTYESYWFCTEDCNGGTCVPQELQPGELCVYEYNWPGMHWPGFVDCNGECLQYGYYDWVGDGWCDDGWGYSFNCEALDFDNGDCDNSCNSGDVNNDGSLDILDIIFMVDCILDSSNTCNCSDVNQDGLLNVMDIIMVVNLILD